MGMSIHSSVGTVNIYSVKDISKTKTSAKCQ